MCRLCCRGDASAAVLRPGDRRLIALVSRTDTASRRLHVLDRSVLSVGEGLGEVVVEEAEEGKDSGMRTGAIARAATRQTAAHLGGAGARVTTAGVRAAAHHRGGESAVLPEVVLVDGDAARAIRMPATGAPAGIAAVAATAVDAGDSSAKSEGLIIAGSCDRGFKKLLPGRESWHLQRKMYDAI
jgi:hypothetical protein